MTTTYTHIFEPLAAPLETLLYSDAELMILRRRVERLGRRFGLPGRLAGARRMRRS